MRNIRRLMIERMREEARVGLRVMTTEEIWALVDELLEAQDALILQRRYQIPLELLEG